MITRTHLRTVISAQLWYFSALGSILKTEHFIGYYQLSLFFISLFLYRTSRRQNVVLYGTSGHLGYKRVSNPETHMICCMMQVT